VAGAIAAYEQSLQTFRQLGDVHGVAVALMNLGSVYREQGQWQEAIAAYEQSLQTFRELGDVHGVAQTLTNLGTVYATQGQWQEAIAYYEQSLEISRQLGDVHGEGLTLANLGVLYKNAINLTKPKHTGKKHSPNSTPIHPTFRRCSNCSLPSTNPSAPTSRAS
jgi:tetratricopeptide (TPR) repeat protein